MTRDDCGCTIAKRGDSFCIGLCPLHAAAPELLRALTWLANEAAGFLSMASNEIHGTTNMRVLETRIADARAVIAKAEGR